MDKEDVWGLICSNCNCPPVGHVMIDINRSVSNISSYPGRITVNE